MTADHDTSQPTMRPILQLIAIALSVAALASAGDEPVGIRGSEKSPVTVMVFSDFESFPCARSAAVAAGILESNRDVRLIFKHAPAASSPNAQLAHEAALAAGAQGKFWEMHDALFANQQHLNRADLVRYARQAVDRHTYRAAIERDLAEARALGVTTAPTFFVNGRRLGGY
jgi:protein-disulfide isomerase